MVSELLRHCDSLCRLVRWGGEEFVLVCLPLTRDGPPPLAGAAERGAGGTGTPLLESGSPPLLGVAERARIA